jgi:ribosomal protein S15P/S13E
MVHPSYQLNPGDMFQVEVEKVLYGTGQQHDPRGEEKTPKNPGVARRRRLRRYTEKEDGKGETEEVKPWQKFWDDVKNLEGHPKFKEIKEMTQEPHIILSKIQQVRDRADQYGKLDRAGREILKDVVSRTRRLLGNLPEDTKF